MFRTIFDANAGEGLGQPTPDSSEQVNISPVSLLKMLNHGRAGVPLEVMGLLLGSFPDEYTTHVVDVVSMLQRGTGVSVEAIDHVFQTDMLVMLCKLNGEEAYLRKCEKTWTKVSKKAKCKPTCPTRAARVVARQNFVLNLRPQKFIVAHYASIVKLIINQLINRQYVYF